jgi:tetratricopeptide (TPR) repeat protein
MRRILAIAILNLALITSAGCESHARVDSINRMNEGILQFKKQNFSGAEKALQEAIKIDPTHAEAHLNLGKLYRKQERWVDAEKEYQAAIANSDGGPVGDYNYEMAIVQIAQGESQGVSAAERDTKYRTAITSLQASTAADPNLYKAHYQLGYLHEKLDEPLPADAAYRACIKLNARYSPAFVSLGNMYIDYGFSNVAMAVLQTGTQVNETDAAMWNGLGRAQLNLNKPKEAVDAFSKAKAIDPDMPDVLFGLGMAYAEMRDKANAAENLELFMQKANAETPEHTKKAAQDTLARMQDVI